MYDRDQIREQFEIAIEKARTKVARYESLTQPIAPDNAIGRVSRMDAINNKSVNEATLRQARATLAQLEHALQRLVNKDPEFGTCSRCGAGIPFPRLMLMPESDKCVNCAQ